MFLKMSGKAICKSQILYLPYVNPALIVDGKKTIRGEITNRNAKIGFFTQTIKCILYQAALHSVLIENRC
jgi:hypothetical protein